MSESVVPALMAALTHVHVGAGRSPGVVDLPVVRDSFGIPFIPGSSIKGAFKTKVASEKNCLISNEEGRVNCGKNDNCKAICCWLGPESGEDGASRLIVTDFYPLLVPVPSLEHGFIYVTSELLLANATNFDISIGGDVTEISDSVTVGVEKFNVKGVIELNNNLMDVHPFLKIAKKVYVLDDSDLTTLFERTTIKLTRVRLDRKSKTVAGGMLWTEEYVPHGTVFAGAFVPREWKNKYCENGVKVNWKDLLGFQNGATALVLGGKETVGKGIVKMKLLSG